MRSFIRYFKTIVMLIVTGSLMFFPLTVSAIGPVLYEQSPGHFGGFMADGTEILVADEFQLDRPALIDSVTWWGGYATPTATPLTDNFKILLFADDGGQPGAFLQSYYVGNAAARTPTGDWVNPPDPKFSGRPEYQYSFQFPAVFAASARTTYWIAIINVPSSDTWVWEVSGSLAHLGVQRSYYSGPWAPYFDNTAFRLHGKTITSP